MEQNQLCDSPTQPEKSIPPLNFVLSPEIGPISSRTAPNSPNKTSPSNGDIYSSSARKSSQSPTAGRPYMPLRANTEAYDSQKIEHESLFSHRAHTDPIETERQSSARNEKAENEEVKSKASLKSLQHLIDDMKKSNGNGSLSPKKSSKSPKASSVTPIKWPEGLSSSVGDGRKGASRTRKRHLSTKEKTHDSSLNKDSINKSERRVIKTAMKDLEIELGMEERYNTEGDGPDGLFEEDLSDRKAESCKHSRDTGPIRYSKMSEEDAANLFEIRRKELLNFLAQLGANASLVKRKLTYRKPGILKHAQSPEGRKHDFEKERGMRSVKEAFNDSVSPQKFIIYNSNIDTVWNGNQQVKIRTPAKDTKKRQTDLLRLGSDSASDLNRRHSAKAPREKEENTNIVQKNLEASFNQIVQDWQEVLIAKTRKKSNSRNDRPMKSPDDKREAYESIKIDLKKVMSKKKKQQKKIEKEEEKASPVVELVAPKKQSQEIEPPVQPIAPKKQTQETNVRITSKRREEPDEDDFNKQLIEQMRKKNQVVLSDIEEIDMQIRRMKDGGTGRTPKGRREDSRARQKSREKSREVYEESLEEGYAQAARMRKVNDRSRSMGFRNSFFEGLKQNQQRSQDPESLWEDNPQRSRRTHTTDRQTKETSKPKIIENKSSIQGNKRNEPNRRPQSPQSAIEKQRNDWAVPNADIKKGKQIPNNKRFPDNELKIPKAGSIGGSLTANNTPLQSKKGPSTNTKQSMDLGKKLLTLDQSPSMGVLSAVNNRTTGKNKETGQKQQAKQQAEDRNLKKSYGTMSNAPTSRQQPLSGFASPKEPSSALVKSVVSVDSSQSKRQALGSPDNKKILLNSKKNSVSSVFGKKSQSSIDRDLRSETSDQFENLERLHINFQDNVKSPTKTSFCDEVKKILREGYKEEGKTPTNPKGKTITKEHTRTLTGAPKIPKDMFSRVNAELSPSMALRTKVYREGRPVEEVPKGPQLNLPPNSLLKVKGRDLKYVVDDFSNSGVKNKWQQHMKKTIKDEDLFRSGNEAPHPNSEAFASYDNYNVYSANTMQELGTDRKGYTGAQNGGGSLADSESLESFQLKEKYVELMGQVSKATKQLENMKDQNKILKKDIMQNIRKKKV